MANMIVSNNNFSIDGIKYPWKSLTINFGHGTVVDYKFKNYKGKAIKDDGMITIKNHRGKICRIK